MWPFCKSKNIEEILRESNTMFREIEIANEKRQSYESERNFFFDLSFGQICCTYSMNSKTLENIIGFIPKKYRESPPMLFGNYLVIDDLLPDDAVQKIREHKVGGSTYTYKDKPVSLKETT